MLQTNCQSREPLNECTIDVQETWGKTVRLADFVVSYSLEINNRCLRYLAECDARGSMLAADQGAAVAAEMHTVYAESLLARDSRRLTSMWALTAPGWKGVNGALGEHVDGLREASGALTDAASNRRLALRLASLASEDDEAEAILKVARKLPSEVPLTWDDLNDLFADDSACWRAADSFRALADEEVLKRVARSYRKGHRLAGALREHAADGSVVVWLDDESDKFHKWVQLTAHQMELFRGGLSEKTKAQLWYLDKMSDTLRTRAGLRALKRATRRVNVKKSVAKTVVGYIDQQITKMDKRIVRLADGCFNVKPRRVEAALGQAFSALGLPEVTLMDPQVAANTPTGRLEQIERIERTV